VNMLLTFPFRLMQTDVESPMDTVVDDDVPGNPQNVLLYVN